MIESLPKQASAKAAIGVAAVALGFVTAVDQRLAAVIAAIPVVIALLAITRGEFERGLLLATILISGTAGVVRLVNVGPATGMAVLTATTLLATIPFWLLNPWAVRLIPGFLRAFIGWAAVVFIVYPPSKTSVQNLMVFAIFGGLIAISRYLAGQGEAFGEQVNRAMLVAGWTASVLYTASIVTGGIGSSDVIAARAFALFALVALGWALAQHRYYRRHGWLAVILFLLIAASLSRGALGAATGMVALTWLDFRSLGSWIRATIIAVVSVWALAFAVNHVTALHDRFYQGDVRSYGGIALNTSGREGVWSTVWNDWKQSPWIGRGVGSGDDLTARLYELPGGGGAGNIHNDYLRVLHDTGIIGLILWSLALFGLLRQTYRSAHRDAPPRAAAISWASYLGLFGVALAMITDNPLIYLFVMAPLGVLIGLALGDRSSQAIDGTAEAMRGD